jgi:hypothetical protein
VVDEDDRAERAAAADRTVVGPGASRRRRVVGNADSIATELLAAVGSPTRETGR